MQIISVMVADKSDFMYAYEYALSLATTAGILYKRIVSSSKLAH